MTRHPRNPPCSPAPPQGNRRAERAVSMLYLLFFVLWCLGLVMAFLPVGLPEGLLHACPWLAGLFALPLWFLVSCVGAYLVVCGLLVLGVKRYFT